MSPHSRVLRDAVAAHTTPHEVTPRAGTSLDGSVSVLRLPRCRLVHVRYGGDVLVEAPATGERVVATLPLGPMTVTQGRSETSQVLTSGFLLSRHERTLMQPDPWAGSWVLSASPSDLAEHRASLLGTSRVVPGGGAGPARDGDVASAPRSTALYAACRSAWAISALPAETDPGVAQALVSSVESTLLTLLVLAESGADLGAEATQPIDSGSGDPRVDRLIGWLDVHHPQVLTAADLAAAAGVSIRQLQSLVGATMGCTPMELLRSVRLRHARRRLLDGTPQSTTVATVAMLSGIWHLGRFSQQYRAAYGESPSHTLNRSSPS